MNPESFWASVGVGVLLTGVGVALVFWDRPMEQALDLPPHTRSTVLLAALTRPRVDLRYQALPLRVFGAIFVFGGLLLFALTALQLWSYSQAATGSANRELHDAAQQSTDGTPFDEAAYAFVRGVRAPLGYEIDTVTFTAAREQPVCDVRLTSCAPDPASAPVREWDGTLGWKERRRAGSWGAQSCEALAILTAARGWQIEGSRWCTLLPKST